MERPPAVDQVADQQAASRSRHAGHGNRPAKGIEVLAQRDEQRQIPDHRGAAGVKPFRQVEPAGKGGELAIQHRLARDMRIGRADQWQHGRELHQRDRAKTDHRPGAIDQHPAHQGGDDADHGGGRLLDRDLPAATVAIGQRRDKAVPAGPIEHAAQARHQDEQGQHAGRRHRPDAGHQRQQQEADYPHQHACQHHVSQPCPPGQRQDQPAQGKARQQRAGKGGQGHAVGKALADQEASDEQPAARFDKRLQADVDIDPAHGIGGHRAQNSSMAASRRGAMAIQLRCNQAAISSQSTAPVSRRMAIQPSPK